MAKSNTESTPESSSESSSESTTPPLWQFIPLAQFEKARPQEPTQEAVRHGLQTLWKRLPGRSAPEEPETAEAARSLKSAPTTLMDMAAPEPEWGHKGGDGLDEALSAWLGEKDAGSRVIVCGPGSGVDEMVQAWGDDHGIQLVTLPRPEEILASGEWLAQFGGADRPRVILAGLERCYLRHPDGLDLLRGLLDRIWQGEITGLFTCDSWAWTYLNRVLQIESILPGPQTLAPLDGDALARWFRALAQRHPPRILTFRQTNDGRPILVAKADGDPEAAEDELTSNQGFLNYLAARSRGNPGVARAIWRESLQVDSEEAVESKAQEEAAADRGYTMWVNPWPRVNLPGMPANSGQDEAFVLHALLLHNGLAASVLPELVPLSREQVIRVVQRLRTARLVAGVHDRWQVTPLGYPAVRSFLAQEGFLIDVL